MEIDPVKPDFLIIGAQKCGTTWLWHILDQHPGTDLKNKKEIQYFSSSKNYHKGLKWYYQHFKDTDPEKIHGEASTDYFHDHVLIDNRTIDRSLPTIPELIREALPEVKILLILRDPVQRAISAYYHHLQHRRFAPGTGIIKADENHPRLRIIERGFYARYLKIWQSVFPPEVMKCFIFEKDVLETPQDTVQKLYSFLGLDDDFTPQEYQRSRNKRWGWSHLWLNYHLGSWYGLIYRGLRHVLPPSLKDVLDEVDFVSERDISKTEIPVLNEVYHGETEEVEELLSIDLGEWNGS